MCLSSGGKLTCPHCSSTRTHKDGRDRAKNQRHRCSACRRSFTDRTSTPFTKHRWPQDVIVMAVRLRAERQAPPHRIAPRAGAHHQTRRTLARPHQGPDTADARLGRYRDGAALAGGRVELAQAVQRGNARPPDQDDPSSVHERSRLEVTTFSWLAAGLRTAA